MIGDIKRNLIAIMKSRCLRDIGKIGIRKGHLVKKLVLLVTTIQKAQHWF
jgi:hypothetical protein